MIIDNLNDLLTSIFDRFKIINTFITSPDPAKTIQEISQNTGVNNSQLPVKYCYWNTVRVGLCPQISYCRRTTLRILSLIPNSNFENRTGLHHGLLLNHKQIAVNDDSLMHSVMSITDLNACKQLTTIQKSCSQRYVYLTDSYAMYEGQLLKHFKTVRVYLFLVRATTQRS